MGQKKCPRCGGSGRFPDQYVPGKRSTCDRCQGSGVVEE